MNEQQNITLSLPVEAVQVVMAGLEQLPLGRAIGLYQHIAGETQRQIAEAQKTKEKANVDQPN